MSKELKFPLYLDPAVVLPKIAKAVAAGRTGAQKGEYDCMYRYESGCPCVIGAGIPKKYAQEFDAKNEQQIDALARCDLVKGPRGFVTSLAALQRDHDVACSLSATVRVKAISRMKKRLQKLLTRHGIEA